MRSVSVVCDNHTDRPAVATYYVARYRSETRVDVLLFSMPRNGRYLDLCGECADILGWRTLEPEEAHEEGEPANAAQRRLIFVRCREIGIDEDARHALLERVTGDPSTRNLLARDVDAVIKALNREAAVR